MQIQSVTVFYQYNTKNINETNYENAIKESFLSELGVVHN